MPKPAAVELMENEAVDFCRRLIQIDTTNYGGNKGAGELEAARYVVSLLEEVGLRPELYESAPGRANVVVRLKGSDSSLPALVVHGHLDVVPAITEDWSVDPFGAELINGMIWGRGAVDMKNMDAMIIAAVRHLCRERIVPQRDLVIAFFADEEAGGDYGAGWMVQNHPELFDGATEAISEVGGFSVEINGRRAYMLQTAEKGIAWLKLTAHGTAGHGSQINTENPVTRLADAVSRIGGHQWPLSYTKTTRALMENVAELAGLEFTEEDPAPLLEAMGNVSRFVGATLQNTANPSALEAGYKHNVIPGHAEALVDCRTLPTSTSRRSRKSRSSPGSTSSCPWCTSRIRWRSPSPVRWWTPWSNRCWRRTRTRWCCRTCSPAERTTNGWQSWGSPATGSRRCSFRPNSISPACSTGSTNGFRSTRSSSACVCLKACCAATDTQISRPPDSQEEYLVY